MAQVVLSQINKFYDGAVHAVKDVNLDIRDREFMVFVGPSGCGKTTTLRMIAGLEEISSGDIRIGTQRVNDLAPMDRDIAMVFQNYALYPHMSVFDNMAFGLKMRKFEKDEIRKRVQDAAEILGIQDLLKRKPRQLSGGQRQRVALGRAIVRHPQVFLFDEPLSNLDAKLRGQMRTEILRMQRRLGITTVYVTHDQTDAMTLGDRVALLRRGELQQVATPRDLYEQPVNIFVAGFIGSPPMNFVPAHVQDGTMKLPFTSFELPEELTRAVGDREWVIVGIRPERFEDVDLIEGDKLTGGVEFEAKIDVVEWLGNEQYAYIPYDAPESMVAGLAELERELDSERMRSQLIVALEPMSRIHDDSDAALWVDPRRMLIFDPQSGDNLTLALQR
ncbi:MAG: ABC transporter ATP-binding protein [Microvirga sp.]